MGTNNQVRKFGNFNTHKTHTRQEKQVKALGKPKSEQMAVEKSAVKKREIVREQVLLKTTKDIKL